MLNISINDNSYKCPEDWHEIDLGTAVALSEVCNEMPEELRRLYNGEEVELTKEQEIKHLPAFFGNVMAVLTDVPSEVIAKCNWQYRTAFYQEWLNRFVGGLLFVPDYTPEKITEFTHNDVTYKLPRDKNVLGSVRPMAEEQTITFTESVDLQLYADKMQKGKLEVMANVISIICRPEGEEYDEEVSLARAEEFMTLPMTVVWEVFFYLIECIQPLSTSTLICLNLLESSRRRQPLAQA